VEGGSESEGATVNDQELERLKDAADAAKAAENEAWSKVEAATAALDAARWAWWVARRQARAIRASAKKEALNAAYEAAKAKAKEAS
jgi:hypothetical protein